MATDTTRVTQSTRPRAAQDRGRTQRPPRDDTPTGSGVDSGTATRDPSWVVVAVSGDLDLAATRPLAVLHAAVANNPGARILVDLSNVKFLDSSALNALSRAIEIAASAGGALTLHGASKHASKVLQVSRLEPGLLLSGSTTPVN